MKLSPFAGVEVSIDPLQSDDHVYTLILKDQLLPRNPVNGREQSTVSWELDFAKKDCSPEGNAGSPAAFIFIPWDHFKPTYRGKPCSDSKPLDLSDIKRISIMIRRYAHWSLIVVDESLRISSFFGSQQGDFRLRIKSIAVCSSPLLDD
ncbi:hypothetical protein A1O1_06447 [Capronia coronata CBS 617.96]|uniref:NADH:ubiquinone oxidoreductase intermediate-associated protein 30 domain-containing protein n=1 Tax=Capronia coronata CBS 617.96 TaxID=1182541 RepID=W9Y0R5_9EURO|nr:uncharacterized protein A1O1_06447 [Capronia coronata CBS 617.96]EXJ86078.1 hypothetical protein A1O1_06447 [Capronia coronata CBS 617.96]